MTDQNDLFAPLVEPKQVGELPTAAKLRPKDFAEYIGAEKLKKQFPFLNAGKSLPSLILWGPPGCGKTTLAHILAAEHQLQMFSFSAVLGGVKDLKELIEKAKQLKTRSLIFIDEIHRFNKAQQDALLPYVENGAFVLVGATTENPRTSVNKALLSRVQVIQLKAHSLDELRALIDQSAIKLELNLTDQTKDLILKFAQGDARRALNFISLIEQNNELQNDSVKLKEILIQNTREYDRNEDRHYDVISAYIKSVRGSIPDAALLWLAVMLDGGEDPFFIARRLVILASEDIGNADPAALTLAVSTLQTVQHIGMPEARIPLAQATTYLACTVKSNASYLAIDQALEYVKNNPTLQVPNHLKNFPPPNSKKYLYPHDYPNHWVQQEYTVESIPEFYRPTDQGIEKKIAERLIKTRLNEP